MPDTDAMRDMFVEERAIQLGEAIAEEAAWVYGYKNVDRFNVPRGLFFATQEQHDLVEEAFLQHERHTGSLGNISNGYYVGDWKRFRKGEVISE
jgi:hypothetical protein